MVEFTTINSIKDSILKENFIAQITAIFYMSSSIKEFSSEERRAAFFKRWCGDYLSLYPNDFYLMFEGEKVLGYLCLCIDSTKALKELEVPGFDLFSDQFITYPAHLHINFHPDCRGRGLGSQLVLHCIAELKKSHICGLHLVTSPDAQNVSFYQRLGFNYQLIRPFNQHDLLFMGMVLD